MNYLAAGAYLMNTSVVSRSIYKLVSRSGSRSTHSKYRSFSSVLIGTNFIYMYRSYSTRK